MKKIIQQTYLLSLFVALLFTQVNAQDWMQNGTTLSGDAAMDLYGYSVSLNLAGDIMAVGSPKSDATGKVKVYTLQNDDWVLMGSPIEGEIIGEDFGWSLSLSDNGETLIVGAPDDNGSGANAGYARIFEWSGTDWIQKGTTLDGINSDDYFGREVDISSDGNTVIVGAPLYDGANFNSGAIFIYEWDGTDWSAKGVPPGGGAEYEEFGQTVGISSDGNTIIVGSPYSFSGYYTGMTSVYEWSSGAWFPKGNSIEGLSSADHEGTSVEISGDGNSIAIGSFNADDGNTFNAGSVRVFDWDGTDWSQRGSNVYGSASYDLSSIGMSLSDDGNTLAVGAPWNDGNGDKSGQVKVYQWNSSEWTQVGTDLFGEMGNDQLGRALSLSGDGTKMAAGIPYDETTIGQEAGSVMTYTLTETSATSDPFSSSAIQYFPNPTDGQVKIELDQIYTQLQLTIYNTMGQVVASQKIENAITATLQIDGSEGMYFLELETTDNKVRFLKILKQL